MPRPIWSNWVLHRRVSCVSLPWWKLEEGLCLLRPSAACPCFVQSVVTARRPGTSINPERRRERCTSEMPSTSLERDASLLLTAASSRYNPDDGMQDRGTTCSGNAQGTGGGEITADGRTERRRRRHRFHLELGAHNGALCWLVGAFSVRNSCLFKYWTFLF